MSRGWNFEVVEVDAKRIFQVKVERLLGFFEGEDGEEDGDESLVRGFFNRKNSDSDDDGTGVNGDEESAAILAAVAVETAVEEGISHAEAVSRQARVSNTLEANRVERLVEQNEVKAAKVKDEKQISE